MAYGGMTEDEICARWDATVALFLGNARHWGVSIQDHYAVGIVQRATKNLTPGDVVIVSFNNGGGQRQPAWCRTRRGWSVRNLFVEYCNYQNDFGDMWGRHRRAKHHVAKEPKHLKQLTNKSTIFLLEPPHGGADASWPPLLDAAVRRYVVESTRAWHAASRVGASSPALSTPEGDLGGRRT